MLEKHLAMAATARAGVLAVSWYIIYPLQEPSHSKLHTGDCILVLRYPPGQADEHGPPSDGIIPLLLERALARGVAICIHVEPYEGRNAESLHKHLKYVHETYGSHSAYYKIRRGTRSLPVFYIYDSYRYFYNRGYIHTFFFMSDHQQL